MIWFFKKPGTEGLSVVNKVTWQKAGRVTEPGRYMFRYGWLTVTAEDLAVWQQFPDATFTLVQMPAQPEDAEEYRLGAFELPTTPVPDATALNPPRLRPAE